MNIAIIGYGFVGKAVNDGFCLGSKNYLIDPILNSSLKDLNNINIDLIFVCVPTPMSDDGSIDLSIIMTVFEEIKEYCNNSLVVIKSTVTPDSIDQILKIYPNTIYNPEFLREKYAHEDFKNASFLIFGGEQSLSKKAAKIYNDYSICLSKNNIYTDIYSASLIKYSINSFLALKVTFFNELFHLFSKTKGNISWQDFTDAISSDNRIGKSHMQVPGDDKKLGFGGACFPKDTAAFVRFSQSVNSELSLLKKAIDLNNEIRSSYKNLEKREKEQGVSFNKNI